ncbi:hypothetical protein L3Q82_015692 [Scortum barcoo]|uniref:Uncharacterized protein n=1 Tax=Scortum barcoo TaxID=214431 RepID=A0ACB8VNX1_9TELE|nr:hypothetical protein L3Q82_015692 [Scortum barcoo]
MVNNEKKAADVFSVFPRFLDTQGLIEQDFRLLFGEVTANKFLERWPTSLKAKVVKESHGLVPTTELMLLLKMRMTGTSVQQHLDNITQCSQHYLLAQGPTRSSIHTFFIVIDKHALHSRFSGSP